MTSFTNCFVCDKRLQAKEFAKFSTEDVVQVLSKVLGDGFVLVIKEEDELCQACLDIVCRIPRLEAELRTATLGLRALLRIKYSLNFSYDQQGASESRTVNEKNQLCQELGFSSSSGAERKHEEGACEPVCTIKETFSFAQNRLNDRTFQGTEMNSKNLKPCSLSFTPSASFEMDYNVNSVAAISTSPVKQLFKNIEGNVEQCESTGNKVLPDVLGKNKNKEEIYKQTIRASHISEKINKIQVIDNKVIKRKPQTLDKKLLKVFKCGMCDFKSDSVQLIQAHFLEFNNKVGFNCCICGFVFHKESSCRIHIKHHSQENEERQCNICKQNIHDRLHMKFHLQKFHTENPFSHVCLICCKGFLFRKNLRKHMVQIHKRRDPSWSCETCNAAFDRPDAYKKHIEYAHRDPLCCNYCGKQFDTSKQLASHEYTLHKWNSKEGFKCKYCKKVKFKHLKSLKLHEERHFLEKMPHKCTKCNRGFQKLQMLEKHLKIGRCKMESEKIVSRKTPTMCELCGKVLSTTRFYKEHQKSHMENPKMYECNICNKKFKYRQSVHAHKRKAHKNLVMND